ncbi:MAG: zinc-dependent alcohol dehydrogenase family protein [Candidatus Methanomethyliaceae archaeon]|nr:zinc-dependent alcohol dehydrogenase family protein [Candidatus Methanomethyliaceae archaeon]MDW7970809.1 zinc-dependent alcohol dehydrogenase family protein [Nitrososphaerota archaeon]
MRAMVLREYKKIENKPLSLEELSIPAPRDKEILIEISVCGICRTELDEVEGRLPTKLPVIPGHQIIGRIKELGSSVKKYRIGKRVGVAWIYSTCGLCNYCKNGLENLCSNFIGTGCNADGGYAEYIVVNEDFVYPIPERFSDSEAAPLLCAGAIGYRALKLCKMKDGDVIALYGFGSSAHIVFQLIRFLFPNSKIFVFTKRRGDRASELALSMGADWVGETGESPPIKFNCAIDTTPVGVSILEALRNLDRGGRLIINLIRKETSINGLDYVTHLWGEREIKTVANVTRNDVSEFLEIASRIPIKPEIVKFRLEEANDALLMLKYGKYTGSGILVIR